MTSSKTAAPSRFLTDATGTYDLAAVSAITPAGKIHNNVAILLTEGGLHAQTGTPYPVAVAAWSAYLDEETPAPAPAETQASGSATQKE
jgi:hypothetical protein